jgi:hypothetical protein
MSQFTAPKESVSGCLNYESRQVPSTRHTEAKAPCSTVPDDKFRQSAGTCLKSRGYPPVVRTVHETFNTTQTFQSHT